MPNLSEKYLFNSRRGMTITRMKEAEISKLIILKIIMNRAII